MVVILLVESREHHVLLVALEGLFDSLDFRFHLLLNQPLFFLPAFGDDVERKTAKGDDETETDYRDSRAFSKLKKENIENFKQLLDRMNNQVVKKHRLYDSVF